MKIIISNEEIIASDDEFLNFFDVESIDDLKISMSSMLMFSLLSEEGKTFEFPLVDKDFFVETFQLISDNGEIKLYDFKNPNEVESTQPQINTKKEETKIQESALTIENEPLLSMDSEPELSLNLNEEKEETSTPINEEPLLSIDFGDSNQEQQEETKIQEPALTIENEPSVSMDFEPELSLNLNEEKEESSTPINEEPLLSIDFGDSNQENKEETKIQESALTIENEPSLSMDSEPESSLNLNEEKEETSTPINEEPLLSIDFGDSNQENKEEETKSDDYLKFDLDLGIENKPAQQENTEIDELDLGIETNKDSNKKDSEPIELDFGFDDVDDIADIANLEQNNTTISEDIQNFLHLDKAELNQNIEMELKKASDDLGVDIEMMKQFFDDFKQQVEDEKEIFKQNTESQNYEEVHKSAHKLKGVALNLRLTYFGELFKSIDNMSKNQEDMEEIKSIVNSIYNIIDKLNDGKVTFENNLSKEDQDILIDSIIEVIDYYIETYSNDTENIDSIINELKYASRELGVKNLEKELDELTTYSKKDVLAYLENLKSIIAKGK